MNSMKIDELMKKWNELKISKEYLQRVDSSHPLDFFVGIDIEGFKELVLITEYEPAKMRSSKFIIVSKGKRNDGKWAIQIKLTDESNQEVFSSLCIDLIESTYKYKNKLQGMQAVVSRFFKWQELLENGVNGMSNEAIKGLIGELVFAEKVLFKRYSLDEVIDSWVGPEGADRDFVLDDGWFEVKAVATGKLTVGISSLNQLDTNQLGYLVIETVDSTSSTDTNGFSFSSLIKHYRTILNSSPSALFRFEEKLLNLGYYDKKEYNDKFFRINDISFYIVNSKFPRLTPSNVNNSIGSAKYELIIPEIQSWKVMVDKLWN